MFFVACKEISSIVKELSILAQSECELLCYVIVDYFWLRKIVPKRAITDDFSKPKIVYPETTQGAYFAFDDKGLFIDKTCFMLISDEAQYLQHTLSSRLFEFAYKNIFSSIELGEHGYQYNKHALVKLPVLKCSDSSILNDVQDIDENIYTLYDISEDEIRFIESR